jgi:hypothetical protein
VYGGASWVRLLLSSAGISSLVFDPRDSQTIYADLAKSTDGGATWNYITSAGLTASLTGLAVDPQNPSRLYAATWGGGVFTVTLSEQE